MRTRIVVVLLMSFALPALGKTYKYAYPVLAARYGALSKTPSPIPITTPTCKATMPA